MTVFPSERTTNRSKWTIEIREIKFREHRGAAGISSDQVATNIFQSVEAVDENETSSSFVLPHKFCSIFFTLLLL